MLIKIAEIYDTITKRIIPIKKPIMFFIFSVLGFIFAIFIEFDKAFFCSFLNTQRHHKNTIKTPIIIKEKPNNPLRTSSLNHKIFIIHNKNNAKNCDPTNQIIDAGIKPKIKVIIFQDIF